MTTARILAIAFIVWVSAALIAVGVMSFMAVADGHRVDELQKQLDAANATIATLQTKPEVADKPTRICVDSMPWENPNYKEIPCPTK